MKFLLPPPPSVNNLFFNVRRRIRGVSDRKGGRRKSGAYLKWIADADSHYVLQRLFAKEKVRGPYVVTITVPDDLRGDIDNRIKPIIDWMVSRNITEDDQQMKGVTILRSPLIANYVEVRVEEAWVRDDVEKSFSEAMRAMKDNAQS